MTAEIIQATYDDLETLAASFGDCAEANADLYNRIVRGFQALQDGGWQGRGAAAFFAEMDSELLPAMQRLTSALAEGRAVLLEIKSLIEEAEEEAASPFRGSYQAESGSSSANGQPVKAASTPERNGGGAMGVVHEVLDWAGFVPGLGAIPDAINAGIYAIEGDWGNAALSGAAAIPIVGDAIKGVDKARDVVKAVDKADDALDASKAIDKADDALDATKTVGKLQDLPPITAGQPPKASDLVRWAEDQGWQKVQTPNGPAKYVDENGLVRATIKRGSSRAPGSETPHIELRNADGQRIDPAGNPVDRKSPGNHTPIDWDLE